MFRPTCIGANGLKGETLRGVLNQDLKSSPVTSVVEKVHSILTLNSCLPCKELAPSRQVGCRDV